MNESHSLRVGHIAAQFSEIKLSQGLVISRVSVHGRDVQLESDPLSVHLTDRAPFTAHVKASDLEQFLNARAPAGLKDVKIKVQDGLLHIAAVKSVIVDLPVKATCKLKIVEGCQIFVELQTVEVAGTGMRNLLQSQLDKINPVIDTRDLPVDIHLDSIDGHDDQLDLTGTMALKG